MDQDTQLLTTGRVIAAARKIETRLAECGATGSGMREKVESLGPRLPAETRNLINHIGGVRNRFAHESGADLRADELELFEEAVEAVLEDLDELSAAPPPKPERPRRKTSPPPSPDDVPVDTPDDPEKPLPPWTSPMWAYLPGPHLVYAFLTAWNAFGAGQLYLLLLLAELGSLTALGFAAALSSPPLAIAGGSLFAAIWLCGLVLGLRRRTAEQGVGFSPVPLLNLVWFSQKIIVHTDPARLVVAGAILGIWLAAIQLAVSGEYAAALLIGLMSWIGALADSFFHRH